MGVGLIVGDAEQEVRPGPAPPITAIQEVDTKMRIHRVFPSGAIRGTALLALSAAAFAQGPAKARGERILRGQRESAFGDQ
jgi:hypothetical protein